MLQQDKAKTQDILRSRLQLPAEDTKFSGREAEGGRRAPRRVAAPALQRRGWESRPGGVRDCLGRTENKRQGGKGLGHLGEKGFSQEVGYR